jgi:hypothetical protein
MKNFKKSQPIIFCLTLKSSIWIRVYFFLISLLFLSCDHQTAEKNDELLNIEMGNDSIQFSMNILPNQIGKFEFKNKFFGIIPRKLTESSQEQEIEFYIIDAPTFKLEEFTIENIKEKKLSLSAPKKISSFVQLERELNSLDLGINNVTVVAKKIDASVKNGKLTVKDLDNKTTTECTCPCSVTFDDKVKVSCD